VTALALAAHGLPPLGIGKFVGSRIEEEPRYAFYVVQAWRTDRDALVAQARARGASVWLYGGPEYWRPESWRESREHIRREVQRLGCDGYIADPENGWPSLPRERRRVELRELGEALRDDALTMRVGVSFFPGFPDLRTLADACGEGVFAVVQVYGLHAFSAEAFRGWVERARDAFGYARTAIAIAGWAANSQMNTAEGYARYLAMVPDAPSNFVWALGSVPAHMKTQLAARDVGGSVLGSAAWGTLALVGRPAGVVLLVLVVLFIVGAVAVVRRSRG
jgi:hypothetical protein